MQRQLSRGILAAVLGLGLALPGVVAAQGSKSAKTPKYRGTEEELPQEWSIQKEVIKLESSLANFNSLIESLGSANKELKELLDGYLKDPKNEEIASKIEKKMAEYAKRVVRDFDRITTDQDLMVHNFNSLKMKLGRFNRSLSHKVSRFLKEIERYELKRKAIEKDLIGLAIKIKEARTEEDIAKAKREFSRMHRRFLLQDRYIKGYNRNHRNYKMLSTNLRILTGLFDSLKDKVVDLIGNLEGEKRYLMDNIRLQRDSLQVKRLISEGILNGQMAIKNVSEKLALLYLQVDTFTAVHERISMDLGRFVESQQLLIDVGKQVDKIGLPETPAAGGNVEEAIEWFYKRRSSLADIEHELKEAGKKPAQVKGGN